MATPPLSSALASQAIGHGSPIQGGWLSPAATSGKPLLYVANTNAVFIFLEKGYSQNMVPVGLITNGVDQAAGLYVDRYGNLYVANDGTPSVTVYKPGSVTPSATYTEYLSRPLFPIVGPNGDLFVSDANGTVVDYRHGTIVARRVLQTGGTEADGLAFDSQRNLYVAYRGSCSTYVPSSVVEFTSHFTHRNSLGMCLDGPQSLAVTRSGNIIVSEGAQIDVFPPGTKTPKQVIPAPGWIYQFAITEKENALFASVNRATVVAAPFPLRKSRPLHIRFNMGGPWVTGVAISNGQYF